MAPAGVSTGAIYRGVMPFVAIQVFALILLALFPELAERKSTLPMSRRTLRAFEAEAWRLSA